MKSRYGFSVALVLLSGMGSAFADGIHMNVPVRKSEVPLDSMLAPYHGYDNTNNVEVVLHGYLPNTCYALDKYKIEKDVANHKIRVRQFAVKKLDGACGEDNALPEHFSMLVPFTNVASLGRLPAGDYEIKYDNSSSGSVSQKPLNVKETKKTTVDDFPYASVSNVSAPDIIQKNSKLTINLNGVYTSSCMQLDADNIKVEKQNDVYVVFPILKMKQGVMCTQSLTSFTRTIELDVPKTEGKYLVHVRSMNGKSVNRVVEVTE